MSTGTHSIFGGFRQHPDQILQREMQPKEPEVQIPDHVIHGLQARELPKADARVSSTSKVVFGTVGTAATVAITNKLIDNPPEILTNAGQQIVNGAGAVAGAVGSAAGGAFDAIKSAWDWYSWLYSWSGPLKPLIAIGTVAVVGGAAMMAIGCYRSCRYPGGFIPLVGGGSANTNNFAIHVHNNGAIPDNCTPTTVTTTHPNGDKVVQTGFVCSPAEAYEKGAPLRAVNKRKLAEQNHLALKEYEHELADKKIVLSKRLSDEISRLEEEYDAVAEQNYADKHVLELNKQAGPILTEIEKELKARDYHRRLTKIFEHQLSLLNSHSAIQGRIIAAKTSFDGFAKGGYEVTKELKRAIIAAGKDLLVAEKEIQERNNTNVQLAAHKFRHGIKRKKEDT